MREGLAYGGLPFLNTGCPVPEFGNIDLVWNDKCVVYCSHLSAFLGLFSLWIFYLKSG